MLFNLVFGSFLFVLISISFATNFFCSRNCCLCAVHQSVKELRRAKEQRETKQHKKKPNTGKKKQTSKPNKPQQKHHNKNTTAKQNPFAASETGETGETKSALDR